MRLHGERWSRFSCACLKSSLWRKKRKKLSVILFLQQQKTLAPIMQQQTAVSINGQDSSFPTAYSGISHNAPAHMLIKLASFCTSAPDLSWWFCEAIKCVINFRYRYSDSPGPVPLWHTNNIITKHQVLKGIFLP